MARHQVHRCRWLACMRRSAAPPITISRLSRGKTVEKCTGSRPARKSKSPERLRTSSTRRIVVSDSEEEEEEKDQPVVVKAEPKTTKAKAKAKAAPKRTRQVQPQLPPPPPAYLVGP